MGLFLALIQLLAFLALFVVGEVYLETDRYKARAIECARLMKDHLDRWVTQTVALAEELSSDMEAEGLRGLAQNYYSCRKCRETTRTITLVNSMIDVTEKLLDKAAGEETDRIFNARLNTITDLSPLWTEYNENVMILNDRLQKRIPAAVGKLFRQHRLSELHDLSEPTKSSIGNGNY